MATATAMAPPVEEKIQEICLFSLKATKPCDNLHQDSHCIIGSSHGWLAFLDQNANPFLLNPFSKTRLHLPEKQTLPRIHPQLHSKIDKLVLCGNPFPRHDENYTVVVMHGTCHRTMIAFCRRGDGKWARLESEIETCYDVVCCDRTKTVFVLGPGPTVEVWDMNETIPNKKMTILKDLCPGKSDKMSYPRDLYSTQWYMALSGSGHMFLVVRYIGEFVRYDGEVVYEGDTLTDYASEPLVCPYKTVGFHVFKYGDDGDGKIKWIEVECLDDCAMFLGGNESMMVSTKEHGGELKGNAIYFTDDYWDRMDEDYCYGGHDMGVFKMEDGSIEPLLDCQEQRIVPPPFWITALHAS